MYGVVAGAISPPMIAVQVALACLKHEGWLRDPRAGYGQGAGKSSWRYSINLRILKIPIKVLTMLPVVSRRSLMAACHLHVCGIF